jgi:hypothetical protein
MNGVIVVKRKSHRAKTGVDIVKESTKYADPSYECEKPKNPLDYRRTTYSKALLTKPLWTYTKLTSRHIRELFGEPTRICNSQIEYVLQIPTREVLKIVVSDRGAVTIHGFNRTPTVEKWVDRLVNS